MATGGIFLIALGMIIHGPSEQCTEAEFLGNKITRCENLFSQALELGGSTSKTPKSTNATVAGFDIVGTWEYNNISSEVKGEVEFFPNGDVVASNEDQDQFSTYEFDNENKRLTIITDEYEQKYLIKDMDQNSFTLISLDSDDPDRITFTRLN